MSRVKQVLFSVAAAVAAGLVFEAGARVVLAVTDRGAGAGSSPGRPPAVAISDLNDYQEAHPSIPWVWTLKPGLRESLGEAIEAKERAGRNVAAAYFRERARVLGLPLETPFLRINRAGFRGPELLADHRLPRILTIGDSCTFGTFPEDRTYPRVLEAELARLGKPVEVVNAGVEGYSPRHVLARIEEYAALRPEVVTIYLGWNALFAENPVARDAEGTPSLASTRLLARAGNAILPGGRQDAARRALAREKHVDRGDPVLLALRAWQPSCLADIAAIAERMAKGGSRIVLLTLPGLYTSADPSPKALEIGHLPEWTDNPLVLAKVTERFNAGLAALARRRGYHLVDLAGWSDRRLIPRDTWFFDSVHLHESGQTRIGLCLAREIVDDVPAPAGPPPDRPDWTAGVPEPRLGS